MSKPKLLQVALAVLAVAVAPPPATGQDQAGPPAYDITAPYVEGTGLGGRLESVQASGGVTVKSGSDVLEADSVTGDLLTGDWKALGNVRLTRDAHLLEAPEVIYNILSRAGTLTGGRARYGIYYLSGEKLTVAQEASEEPGAKPLTIVKVQDARVTTCNLERPHWALGARELTVRQGQNGVARRVGVYLGERQLFSVPAYRFGLTSSRQFLPSPGFNEDDGVYLRFNTPFSIPWASASQVSARVSQRNGLSGVLDFQRDLLRPSRESTAETVAEEGNEPDQHVEVQESLPSDFNSINLLERGFRRRQSGARVFDEASEGGADTQARRLLAFARLGINERVFDPDVRYLYLDRRPELGLMAADIPLAKVAKRSLMLNCQVGYGNFREESAGYWVARWDARAYAWTEMDMLGGLRFRPAFILRAATYSTGDTLRTAAWLLQLGKPLSRNYYGTVTHIRHWSTGRSAFRFDNVDVKEKLAAGLEADWGRTTGRLSAELDLARGGFYDWGFDLARTMHCYRPSVSYRHRYRDITAAVTFIAATY